MARVMRVTRVGNQMRVEFDDGSHIWCYPTHVPVWLVRGTDGEPGPDPEPDPGPIDPPGEPGEGDIYNPWAGYNVTGSWANHGSYSAGGIDYPLGNGTPLAAPAAGTLVTSGGSGEYLAGYVGAAGRRSILRLDKVYPRIQPAETYPKEAAGPMTSIVVQHQSRFGDARHYEKGEIMGYSGNSNGSANGGDYHLHVHGLTAGGARLDFTKFVP